MKDAYHLRLVPENNHRLANLCGINNVNLQHIEQHFAVVINNCGHDFYIKGAGKSVVAAGKTIEHLYEAAQHSAHLLTSKIQLMLRATIAALEPTTIHTKYQQIKPRTPNQCRYVERLATHDLNFGIGPAGTGKTYLAVACAVQALEQNKVQRILLVRPAVEAGEKLGFLPGSLAQKIEPYLRPLYDALFEMMGFETVKKLLERNTIEVAPLAYMRGRTLNDAFVILDESQNTTVEQMKMFLTRIGYGSKVVVNGDLTQIDLPKNAYSGLQQAYDILTDIKEISFTHFVAKDIIRHPLVQKIVAAYAAHTQE